VTKKVYIKRIEDPRGLAKPAEASCQGGSREGLTTRGHSGNIQRTFKAHSGHIQGTFRNIQGIFSQHFGLTTIWGTFGEHSGNIQGTFREHSGNNAFYGR
jgi:hypothetical protein